MGQPKVLHLGADHPDDSVSDDPEGISVLAKCVSAPHHAPHFHAYYQNDVAVFGIEPVDLISGALPRRQQRMVEAWAELHQAELLTDWQRLQAGQAPLPVLPLS